MIQTASMRSMSSPSRSLSALYMRRAKNQNFGASKLVWSNRDKVRETTSLALTRNLPQKLAHRPLRSRAATRHATRRKVRPPPVRRRTTKPWRRAPRARVSSRANRQTTRKRAVLKRATPVQVSGRGGIKSHRRTRASK